MGRAESDELLSAGEKREGSLVVSRINSPGGRLLQGASHDAGSIQQIPQWTARSRRLLC